MQALANLLQLTPRREPRTAHPVHYLHWEVDGASGSTRVVGSRALAKARWALYFAPHGYRLVSIKGAAQ